MHQRGSPQNKQQAADYHIGLLHSQRRGHPIGATGLAQIAELVWQMRGDAGPRQVKGQNRPYPKVGLAQNSGGYVEGSPAALTVTILTR